jgi:hypothetical protein
MFGYYDLRTKLDQAQWNMLRQKKDTEKAWGIKTIP